MADDTKKAPMLPVKDVRIIPTQAKSPANEFVDIVEVELALPNEGNCGFFEWMTPAREPLRFRCEHKDVETHLKTMGLK